MTKVTKITFKAFVREQGADAIQGKGDGEPSLRKPLLTRKSTLRNGTNLLNKRRNYYETAYD